MKLSDTLDQRTSQLLAITTDQRDQMDESNPIIFAETGPNRFAVMSLFFSETDGVRIEEHLGLNDISVTYFNDTEEMEDRKSTRLNSSH